MQVGEDGGFELDYVWSKQEILLGKWFYIWFDWFYDGLLKFGDVNSWEE